VAVPNISIMRGEEGERVKKKKDGFQNNIYLKIKRYRCVIQCDNYKIWQEGK